MRFALNDAPVNGWPTLVGYGQAGMALSAAGNGLLASLGVGQAAMSLTTSGWGFIADNGSGVASMTLSASGEPRHVEAEFGEGSSWMALSARHAHPDPIVRPGEFRASHPGRAITAANDNRIIRGARNG